MSITNNAVLVRLSAKTFRRSVTDTDVSEEVTRAKGADDAVGRFVKMLFTPDATRAFTEVQSASQKLLREYCKPWDLGVHILTMARFPAFNAQAERLTAQFYAARDSLIDSLPHHIERARQELGALFDPTLYPDADTLRRQCVMSVRYTPVPDDKNDIRVGDAVAADAMKDAIVRAHEEFGQAVAQGLVTTINDTTQRLDDLVTARNLGQRTRVGKSLIDNVRKAVQDAEAYNFSSDPKVQRVIAHMKANLLHKLDCIPLELSPDDPQRVRAIEAALTSANDTRHTLAMEGLL